MRVHKQAISGTEMVIHDCVRVLSFGLDPHGQLCVWFLAGDGKRSIRLVGTGHDEVRSSDRFIGTARVGPLMLHAFEVKP